jgi:hypothetical protein
MSLMRIFSILRTSFAVKNDSCHSEAWNAEESFLDPSLALRMTQKCEK